MDEDNVYRFGAVQGGKAADDKDGFPSNDYVIIDIDEKEYFATGFLIFTPSHLCIMDERGGKGPVPVFVMPIARVKWSEILEEDDETEQPA